MAIDFLPGLISRRVSRLRTRLSLTCASHPFSLHLPSPCSQPQPIEHFASCAYQFSLPSSLPTTFVPLNSNCGPAPQAQLSFPAQKHAPASTIPVAECWSRFNFGLQYYKTVFIGGYHEM
ncbi:hypothetical protein BDR04DRAFT_1090144 [Suillus decipiens]|nr:hypothetical protein BDR04DRAFT_1090144 [Suillus decipiens]